MTVVQKHTFRLFALMIAASLLIGVVPVWAQSPAEPDDFQSFIQEKTPTLVTIKFVLKINMGAMFGGGGDQETEAEVTGVMIDPKGLILCSNTKLGGFTALIQRFMGEGGSNISAKPTDMKVLVGDDTEGLEAEFLARDSELDLAWVQIKEPGDNKFAYVDFTKSAKPQIGTRLRTLHRMGKHFDRCIVVGEDRVGGITSKPRELYVPTTDTSKSMGLPIYTEDGKVVGVTILQMPDAEDSMGGAMSMFNNMSNFENMSGLILPVEQVIKATKRAKATTRAAKSKPEKDTESAPAEDKDSDENANEKANNSNEG